MRVDIDSHCLTALLIESSISAFEMDLKRIQFHTIYSGILEQIKPQQPVDQAAEFKFEFKFEPLQVIWQSLLKAIQGDNWF